jgi:glucuronate isomerase
MFNHSIMSKFPGEDFLLQSDYAKKLYHGYAKSLPVVDYHSHLPPEDIAGDRQFGNLTQIWLYGDHYKWRAMRTLGVDERYITGKASDEEKFSKWAYTVPFTIRNPLYHWSHLELQRYFNNDKLITAESASEIYKACSEKISQPENATRNLLVKMNVEVVCTTDDPADDLAHHRQIAKDNFNVKVLPTFRPDKAYAIEDPRVWKKYIARLSDASGIDITSFDSLIAALEKRIDFFHQNGCRLSDHGLEQLYYPESSSAFNLELLIGKLLKGTPLLKEEREFFKYNVLLLLGKTYHKKGWAQQFHLGGLRNTNTRMLGNLGPDTGFDSIGDFAQARAMAGFFNELDKTDQLARTIVYNLNPSLNEVMATMIGNFNDGSIKGKMQFGSAWWFLDQKDGMEKQINALSNMGLLSCFIGMLTDSRSFLSYPRHEYFRRILCNTIGKDIENNELPWDEKWLGKVVSDICYYNAKAYFAF